MAKKELWVVSCFFNPLGLRNKIDNFLVFSERIRLQGAKLMVVELSVNDAPFVINENSCDKLIRVKSNSCLWHKERLLNLGAQKLPWRCEYCVFADADILFEDKNWVKKTINALKKHSVVQPFDMFVKLDGKESKAFSLTGDFEYYSKPVEGFVSCVQNKHHIERYILGSALAFRKELVNKIKLYDKAIMGGGDLIILKGLLKTNYLSSYKDYGKPFADDALRWIENAKNLSKENITYTQGKIFHLRHGSESNRNYKTRFFVLNLLGFNPKKHLTINSHGALEWKKSGLRLALIKKMVKLYFISRNEDEKTGKLWLLAGSLIFRIIPQLLEKITLSQVKLPKIVAKLSYYLFSVEKKEKNALFVNYDSSSSFHKLLEQRLRRMKWKILAKNTWKSVFHHPFRFIVCDVVHVHSTFFSKSWIKNTFVLTYYAIMISISRIFGKKVILTINSSEHLLGLTKLSTILFREYIRFISNKSTFFSKNASKKRVVLFVSKIAKIYSRWV